jgi:adenine-specific DNA methylase
MPYPKRLIEVDLPIKQISAHARREKSIRHGHISTLHIWWARRPLAACRAVICAALWPDPADENCPQAFRDAAAVILCAFAEKVRTDKQLGGELCASHFDRWRRTTSGSMKGSNPNCWPDMRYALLDFIADFANWDASTVPAFLETARLLTGVAHAALTIAGFRLAIGDSSSLGDSIENLKSQIANLPRPLVVDPFAGGGSIPLEALRVGADAFASDLNPVAVLLNKVVLEYIPKYGQQLADEVRKWGQWIKEQAEKELAEFYPKDPDGATPIAYLWARTITCEGPGCGAEVPMIRSLWLAKKGERSVALRLLPDKQVKRVDFEIIERRIGGWVRQANPKEKVASPHFDGTVARGSATCPVCGYTTPVVSVRKQLKARHGGAADARLFCVVTTRPAQQGRFYRLPAERDLEVVHKAAAELERRKQKHFGPMSLVPDEKISLNEIRRISVPLYGMETWGDLFAPRQALAMITLGHLIQKLPEVGLESAEPIQEATKLCLALAMDKQSDLGNALCTWEPVAECPRHLFGRQAIGMVWDFAEGVVSGESSGAWSVQAERTAYVLDAIGSDWSVGHISMNSATHHPLPDDAAHALVTDPPYYDAVPYAYLSDFFYVWLRRIFAQSTVQLFDTVQVPKEAEIVVDRPHELSQSTKDVAFYERELTKAFADGRRLLRPDGIGTIVFASKTTASWEAILRAIAEAGWTLTASWPIDTEMDTRIAAQGQARLASSIHLVCRPRENPDGSLQANRIGDWRDVLAELPGRIHDWMPRLAAEGVVGADAIFACLGPALEIFSRYARVEKASGEQVTLKEYMEYVWAAVSKEALVMIFEGADASGFEEDARLTAMWLWTLAAGSGDRAPGSGMSTGNGEAEEDDEDEGTGKKALVGGYVLEYDAARKISQGLGAHLERLSNLIEVKGDKSRLLPVAERAGYLMGKADEDAGRRPLSADARRKQALADQLALFGDETLGAGAATASHDSALGTQYSELAPGNTTLDQVHQSMLLFAAGRGDGLKNYLLTTGVGRDQRFWRLAQALSALYPASSDEKRWVDGVLARKKGLGL